MGDRDSHARRPAAGHFRCLVRIRDTRRIAMRGFGHLDMITRHHARAMLASIKAGAKNIAIAAIRAKSSGTLTSSICLHHKAGSTDECRWAQSTTEGLSRPSRYELARIQLGIISRRTNRRRSRRRSFHQPPRRLRKTAKKLSIFSHADTNGA